MIKNAIWFMVILLLITNVFHRYKESKRTGERFMILMGGPFCLLAIVILLLDLFMISG